MATLTYTTSGDMIFGDLVQLMPLRLARPRIYEIREKRPETLHAAHRNDSGGGSRALFSIKILFNFLVRSTGVGPAGTLI